MNNKSSCTLQAENPQSYEETVEVMMIGLRKLCEGRQRDHTHISDHNKNTFKTEVLEIFYSFDYYFILNLFKFISYLNQCMEYAEPPPPQL